MPSLRHTKSEEHLESTISTSKKATENGATNGSTTVPPPPPPPSTKPSVDAAADATVPVVAVHREWNEHGMTEDDVWSQEDDEITAQYLKLHKMCERDAVSQMSLDSIDSREQSWLIVFFFIFALINIFFCFQLKL